MFQPQASEMMARVLVVALGFAGAAGAESVSITKVQGIQPGWVRVTVAYEAWYKPAFKLTPTCTASTDPDSVVAETFLLLSRYKTAVIDLKANLDWLEESGLPEPCSVTALQVELLNGSTVKAKTNLAITFPMDLPLSHLTPFNDPSTTDVPWTTSVSLQWTEESSRWAAYPPRLIEVVADYNLVTFIEVEELPERGTVGLRRLASVGVYPKTELGGGAEIPGWGIDTSGPWIMKDTSGSEESNPGHDWYNYNGIYPPLITGNTSVLVLPAPPLFSETTYLANVLDNREAPRCPGGKCLDVIYDPGSHSLEAVNGAYMRSLDRGPILSVTNTRSRTGSGALNPDYEARMVRDLAASVRAVRRGRPLPARIVERMALSSRNPRLPILDLAPVSLPSSVAPGDPDEFLQNVEGHRALVDERGLSPQELSLVPTRDLNAPVARNLTGACVINSTHDGVTSPISRCDGFSNSPFRCPTPSDPLRPEALPEAPGSATDLSLYETIPPYYRKRDNLQGTCGSHAFTQYYEALLDKYSDDLAPKRVIYVDNLPITVPAPRVATSVTSGLWEGYTWSGTKAGDPEVGPITWPADTDPSVKGMFPFTLLAYWPGFESAWSNWAAFSNVPATDKCEAKGFWWSGFCIGQGQPPPGAYRNYAQMLKSYATGVNPVGDLPWSLANTYFNVVSKSLSLNNPDAAIHTVVAELKKGLPVYLTFSSGASKSVYDGNGTTEANKYALGDNATWYLPPELGACDRATLDDTFGPDNGHAVNIVGYSVQGSLESPDPYNSYFIIENNWGKSARLQELLLNEFRRI